MTLHNEDAAAVDLLLDRACAKAEGGSAFTSPDVRRDRIARVQSVLELLQWMPEANPPHDLVGRTLRYINSSANSDNLLLRDRPFPLSMRPHV